MLQPCEKSPGCRELNAPCCYVMSTCISCLPRRGCAWQKKTRLVNVKFLAKQENCNRNSFFTCDVIQSSRTKWCRGMLRGLEGSCGAACGYRWKLLRRGSDVPAIMSLVKYCLIIFIFFYFFILYSDQQMHNELTNYHTPPTCFDTIVSSSGSS